MNVDRKSPDPSTDLIDRIHQSEAAGVILLTGGGSRALSQLLSRPGASSTLLAVDIPYSAAALARCLLREPGQAVSSDTALALARQAFRRARQASAGPGPRFGVGVTAALATNRTRRGADRAWIAWCDGRGARCREVDVAGVGSDRDAQEEALAEAILAMLAAGCGVTATALPAPAPEATDELGALREGATGWIVIHPDGRWEREGTLPPVVVPGSFDPLHLGHSRLLDVGCAWFKKPGALELSLQNADKPPLDDAAIAVRLATIRGRHPVVLTAAATFAEKAERWPGSCFVLGMDTFVRLVNPRYYEGETGRAAALETLVKQDCRFLVAGRECGGQWECLDVASVPPELAGRVEGLSEAQYRDPHESTRVRALRR